MIVTKAQWINLQYYINGIRTYKNFYRPHPDPDKNKLYFFLFLPDFTLEVKHLISTLSVDESLECYSEDFSDEELAFILDSTDIEFAVHVIRSLKND